MIEREYFVISCNAPYIMGETLMTRDSGELGMTMGISKGPRPGPSVRVQVWTIGIKKEATLFSRQVIGSERRRLRVFDRFTSFMLHQKESLSKLSGDVLAPATSKSTDFR